MRPPDRQGIGTAARGCPARNLTQIVRQMQKGRDKIIMKPLFPYNNETFEKDVFDLDADAKDSDPVMKRALFKGFLNHMKSDNDRIVPDKRGCECLFVRGFVRDKMGYDFPLIARDFVKHEAAHFNEYQEWGYFDDLPQRSDMDEFWKRTMVRTMYTAAKKGSEYSLELLKYLFKTYYSKLYKSFKRFRVISADEVISLAQRDDKDDDRMDIYMMSIVLCMTDIYGIRTKQDCDSLYFLLNEQFKEFEKREEVAEIKFPEGHFEQCKQEIDAMFGDAHSAARAMKQTEKFLRKILEYEGFSGDFVNRTRNFGYGPIGDLYRTLELLKLAYPNREFTKNEILLYSGIYVPTDALLHTANALYDALIDVMGLGDDAIYEPEETLFDPDKVMSKANVKKQEEKQAEKNPEPMTEDKEPEAEQEYPQELRMQELENLRDKLHSQEQENAHLRNKLREAKHQQEKLGDLLDELENNRQELAALRSHLYNLTEYEEMQKVANVDAMVADLEKKRVTIIGGHINWVQKMKKLFPQWNFISPNVSISNDNNWVKNADHVYFFTDTLSHSVYNKFVQAVRSQEVPFGYIHGVNIDLNVKQIWDEIVRG